MWRQHKTLQLLHVHHKVTHEQIIVILKLAQLQLKLVLNKKVHLYNKKFNFGNNEIIIGCLHDE